jgi:hypothetical protein
LRVATATVTFWTAASGGSQVTDLLDASGNAASSITTDSSGQLPSFQGPNDASAVLWASAGGGARARLGATDSPSRIATNEAAITALPATYGVLAGPNTWTGTQDFTGATVTGIAGGGGGNTLAPTAVKTAAYTAAAFDLVPVSTASNPVTITLPSTPADKAQVAIKHVIQGASNAVTVACGGSAVLNKAGGSTSFMLPLVGQGALLQYKASGAIWYVLADDLPLAQLDGRFGPIRNPLFEVVTLDDSFTRSDGALGNDPNSGYLWNATGVNPPVISGNKMINPAGASTAYATFALARPPKEIWGIFSLAPGSGTNTSSAGMVLALSSVAAQSPFYLVHPQFTQNGCSVQKFVNGTSTPIGTVNWTSGLAIDSTSLYTVGMRLLDANTVAIYGPDGKTYTLADPDNNGDVGKWWGRLGFASIEPQDVNAPNGRWHHVWAVEPRTANAQSAPSPRDLWLPANAVGATYDRFLSTNATLTPLTSGTLYCAGTTLAAGVPINWVGFFSGSTAAVTPTHQWAVLMDLSGRVIAVSADRTNAAWAANSFQQFTFTSQFIPGGPMAVWIGLCVVAGTVPTLAGVGASVGSVSAFAPNMCGPSSTGQSAPPAVGAFLAKPSAPAGYPFGVYG